MSADLAARILSNVAFFLVDICIISIFALFLLQEMKWSGLKFSSWYHKHRTQGAIALATYFAGQAMARAYTVIFLTLTAQGYSNHQILDLWMWPLAGTVVAMIGAFCTVRVFIPTEWSLRAAIFAASITALGAFGTFIGVLL